MFAITHAAVPVDEVRVVEHRVAAIKAKHNPNGPAEVLYVTLEIEHALVSQEQASLRVGATSESPGKVTTSYNRDVKKGSGKTQVRIEVKKFRRDTLDVLVWLDRKLSGGGETPEPLKFQKLTFEVSKL